MLYKENRSDWSNLVEFQFLVERIRPNILRRLKRRWYHFTRFLGAYVGNIFFKGFSASLKRD